MNPHGTDAPRTLAALARTAIASATRAQAARGEGAHITPASETWWHDQDAGPNGEPATLEASLEGMVISTRMDQEVFDHPGHHVEPDDTPGRWPQCLFALDSLARGEWSEAARTLHGNERAAARFADAMHRETYGTGPQETCYHGWQRLETFMHDFAYRIAPAIAVAETTR